MATIAQFSKNMRRRGRQVENSASRLVRAVGKRTLRALVLATPVDTGQARSNWRVGIGAAPTAVIEPYAPGRNLGRGETANAAAAIAAGIARIDTLRGISGVGLKTSLIIANNVPYIEKLNDGYSAQAPAGFIETATAEARAVIAGFRLFNTGGDDEDGD